MTNVRLSGIALSVAAILASGAASAAPSTTTTMGVTAAIAAECAVTPNTSIAFGNLDMLNGGLQSTLEAVRTGSFNAICTNGTANPKFKYSSANGAGNVFHLAGVNDASELITYTLHQDTSGAGAAVQYDTPVTNAGFSADGALHVLDVAVKILPADKNGKKVQPYGDIITITTSFDV